MKILAFEFSSSQRSVAVCRAPELEINEVVEAGQGALRAFAMVTETLQRANLEREQIDCIVVGIGPGSYTGIRVAIALAQGWQLARGTPLMGISSAECLAAGAAGEGMTGRVSCVIDAQRGEFYLASYELFTHPAGDKLSGTPTSGFTGTAGAPACRSGSSTKVPTENWREIEPLHLVPLAQIRERAQSGEVLIGPEANRWAVSGRSAFPRASTLARLARQRSDFVAGERLEPIYLRATSFVKAPSRRQQF